LEGGTEPLGFGLSLGKPTAEVFDLVPLLGDRGVLGGKLGPVGALSRAAVLGELHFVSNAGGPQGLVVFAFRASWPMDQAPRLVH
jgi:hypothetical protein